MSDLTEKQRIAELARESITGIKGSIERGEVNPRDTKARLALGKRLHNDRRILEAVDGRSSD